MNIREKFKLNYREYLQTHEWRQKRTDKFMQVGYRCQLCSSQEKLQVHHRTYKDLGNEDLNDLTVLCEDCHSKFHDKFKDPNEDEIQSLKRQIAKNVETQRKVWDWRHKEEKLHPEKSKQIFSQFKEKSYFLRLNKTVLQSQLIKLLGGKSN